MSKTNQPGHVAPGSAEGLSLSMNAPVLKFPKSQTSSPDLRRRLIRLVRLRKKIIVLWANWQKISATLKELRSSLKRQRDFLIELQAKVEEETERIRQELGPELERIKQEIGDVE